MAKNHQRVIDAFIRRAGGSTATTTDAWAKIRPHWSPWPSRHTQDRAPRNPIAMINAANARVWRAGRGDN
jgi:hypothetical protein